MIMSLMLMCCCYGLIAWKEGGRKGMRRRHDDDADADYQKQP